ncbi:penicillin-binding transpeptidase domain-containing protein [Streptomyces sp. IBSNAI002]|uniref:penicillin-binding transpeptidase domain-containing protein n=1 Tax=Streptomyces sp. IBSNAI002 TaxID=3457500 RepID=UPI003FCF2ECB
MPKKTHGARRRARAPRRSWTVPTVVVGCLVLAGATTAAYATAWGPFANLRPAEAVDPQAVDEARAFLADWAGGTFEQAAGRTDDPDTARRTLSSFVSGLDIGKSELTAGKATQDRDGTVTVAFTAGLTVTDLGRWEYASAIPLKRDAAGAWKVNWRLPLVHPHLSSTHKFRLDRKEGTAPPVLDRAGTRLSGATYPLLAPALADLAGSRGKDTGAIHLVNRDSGEIKGTETTFGAPAQGDPGQPVRTTIDSAWQAAAEQAMAKNLDGKNGALVALRIDNGQVLAVANAPGDGFNRAFSGTYAPASTWKIVTSAALMLNGAVGSPDTVVDCPASFTAGKKFTNVADAEHRGATFLKDFAVSCNTAFVSLTGKLGNDELGKVAGSYFGIGQKWSTGIPSYDGSVPAPAGASDKAAAMIGQGKVLANPLLMASVTATAVSGTFQQPVITQDAKATATAGKLPESVVTALRRMMRATVTEGTGTVLAGLPGEVGAKTGTAEVGGDSANNGWLVAHRGNVAIACVVEEGKTGGGSAGPVIKEILTAVPSDPS